MTLTAGMYEEARYGFEPEMHLCRQTQSLKGNLTDLSEAPCGRTGPKEWTALQDQGLTPEKTHLLHI